MKNNNDDTFSGMNSKDNTSGNAHGRPALTPEVEVRVVAWVLGEATPAEAAELGRLAAENPAVGEFKRRIEAVHGLAGAAVRPAGALPRLSEERRAKVLAVIGGAGMGGGADVDGVNKETVRDAKAAVRRVPAWREWALPLAACLVLCAVLSAVLFPAVGAAKKSAQAAQRIAERRAAEQRHALLEFGAKEEAGKRPVWDNAVSADAPMVAFERQAPQSKAARGDGFAVMDANDSVSGLDEARAVAAPAMPAPMAAPAAASSSLAFRNGAGTVTLTGSNTYTGGTVVSGGVLSVAGTGVVDALRTAGEVQAVAQQAAQENPVAFNGVLGGNEAGLSTAATFGVTGTATGAMVAGSLDASEAGKRQMAASDALVSDKKTPVLGDVPVTGRLFKRAEVDRDDAGNSYPVHEAAAQAQDAAEGVTVTAGTVQRFERSPADFDRTENEKAAQRRLNQAKASAAMVSEVTSAWQRPAEYAGAKQKAEEKDSKDLEDAVVARKALPQPFDEGLRAEVVTGQQPVSTFSLHVSDASFRIAKAALARGELPDAASIRPEEFYNAFDYGDPAPAAGEPVSCRIEQSAHPFMQQRNLVRIAMKVPATGRGAGQGLRLTVLLDTSGSMEREDRAASVRAALSALVSLLGAEDRITLIGFARQPHLLADRVPGNQAGALVELAARTPFEGGTNLEEALKLAGNLARGQFTAGAQNRIVVLSDGAANLGEDDPARLAELVTALREQGIAFDACGVGAEGLDDTMLEALTRKGDGRYMVVNAPEEADAGFARALAGAFHPAAENVKVQVHFNPSRVAHYRLIGFEQHRLKTEDFHNDRVDAAELAAEEEAVALYQVEVLPDGEGELGEVAVRFRDAATGGMVERSWTLGYAPQAPAFEQASRAMRLAGASAFLAEKLRGGELAGQIHLGDFAPAVNALRGDYAKDAKVREFVTMFAQARRLTGD